MSAPKRRFTFPWRTRTEIRSDFDEEIAFHSGMRMAELSAQGVPEDRAREIVRRETGDLENARQYVAANDTATETARRRRDTIIELAHDARHVVRRLLRARLASATAVLTLAFGIAACTLIGTIAGGVLLKPLPFADPGRIVMVWGYLPQLGAGFEREPISGRYLTIMRDEAHTFAAIAGFRSRPLNLLTADAPLRLDGVEATGDFFAAVGARAQLGHLFTRADEPPTGARVVVLSDALWRSAFGADSAIVGRTANLNGEPFTIIGVAARDFAFPHGADMPGNFQMPAQTDAWIPIGPPLRGPSDLAVVGRMAPGISIDQVRADLDNARAKQERLIPQAKGWFGTETVSLRTQLVGGSERALLLLLVAGLLVLGIACVNVAQLQLAHLHRRRRDMAVRAALGASGGRLATDLGIEMALLTVAAGVIGTALAWIGVQNIRAAGSAHIPRLSEITFDGRSWAFAIGATLIAGVAASLVPAIMGSRFPVMETLRSGGRTRAVAPERSRRTLIVAELTLSVVLVMSAGLLVRSLNRQIGSPTGFAAPNGLTFEVTLPAADYPEQQFPTSMAHERSVAYVTAALEQLRAIPGVDAAAIGKPLPLSGAEEATSFVSEESVPVPHAPPLVAQYTVASPDMLRALGTPLLRGRDFTDADREDALPVVVVNQAMADRLWPGKDPIGKRIKLGSLQSPSSWMTVIGLTADVKRYSLTESPRPEMTVPYTQRPYPTFSTMQFVVRSARPLASLTPDIRAALHTIDAAVPVSRVRTLDDLLGDASANARFATQFVSAFGSVSLLLALVGLYSVVAFSVHQRRQEFGVRRALGASGAAIVSLVMRDAVRLTALGVALGAVISVASGRLLRHMLYQVSAFDTVAMSCTLGLVAAGTLMASLTPAWRASRVDPLAALRED